MERTFRRIATRTLSAFSLMLVFSTTALASVIDFDDITLGSLADIPEGYAGFNWLVFDEFGYSDPLVHPDVSDQSYAETSGEYAFRGTGFSITPSGGGLFNVLNMIVANENCDDLILECSSGSVRMQGLNGGLVTYDIEYFFDPYDLNPITLVADFFAIEEFRVWNSAAELISLDNLQVTAVPLPGALVYISSALVSLLLVGRRRRQAL